MDWIEVKSIAVGYVKKYRYIVLVLLAGIALMLLPCEETPEPEINVESVTDDENISLQDSLSCILSKISGAGECQVLLTQAKGEEILYQTDDDTSAENLRRDTVLITNENRTENGLIRQVISPTYRGAVVLCRGADNASVRLSIVEAVKSATGLTADHITVLKMK